MALKNDLLNELLKADDYISGEQIASKFSKSRAAVWKAINALKKDGYQIDAVTNKGYRLVGGNNVLSENGIKLFLKNDIDVIYHKSIDSTNNECKRLLGNGRSGEFLVVADEQLAGRGRQGKSFYSPASTGVYFSIVIRPNLPLQNVVTTTTAAAVAVCKALESLTDIKPGIKWVNDVYVDGKKVCGILTEAITNFEEGVVESVIIGIGMNISTKEFPTDVEGAGSLNVNVDKNKLVAEITNEMLNIAGGDYQSFIDYYRFHSLVIGQKIVYKQNGRNTEATAIAIDEQGGLEVEHRNGERVVLRSGEISIRKA